MLQKSSGTTRRKAHSEGLAYATIAAPLMAILQNIVKIAEVILLLIISPYADHAEQKTERDHSTAGIVVI